MNKCPACGYKIDNSYNTSAEISKLMKKRNSKTRKYLNKIASEVTQSIPSESRLSYFQFLFGIKDIDDNVVSWAIEQYYQSRYYLSGKGFAYLRTIVQNRNKNIGVLRKNERLLLGSPPPVIDVNIKEKK
jgi:hypothetical protein